MKSVPTFKLSKGKKRATSLLRAGKMRKGARREPFAKGKGGKSNIQFTPGGFIMNWEPFDRYEVCTNGDCFMAGNEIDVMTVSKSTVENSEKYYGFRYSALNDTLTLYNLATTNPDEKGTYQPKGIAYQFFRKPAE